MKTIIEPASTRDRPELIALLAAQLDEHDIGIDETDLAAAVDGVLADPRNGAFLVARADRRAIGVAYVSLVWSLEHGGLSSWLEELYVVPALRDRGIGTLLVDAVIAHARNLGCAAIDLEIEESHARVASLYCRAGFCAHERTRWVLPLR